jgi:hypothetical protein
MGIVSAATSMSFAPGEAYQFDWSHEIINGLVGRQFQLRTDNHESLWHMHLAQAPAPLPKHTIESSAKAV